MIPLKKPLYTARTRTTGGRDGIARSDDGRLLVKLSTPRTSGGGTNPEQLLAAGWSASFITALKISAGKMKITLSADLVVDAEVDLATTGHSYRLAVRFDVVLPGVEPEISEKLVKVAQQICPYAWATRGNVDISINVVEGGTVVEAT